jgi:hypothetical protein
LPDLHSGGFVKDDCPEQGNELLNGEIFYNLKEAQIVVEQWR